MKLAKRMGRLGTETAFEVLLKARRLEAEGADIIHSGDRRARFRYAQQHHRRGREARSTTASPTTALRPGLQDLRDRIAQEIADTRGISVTGENVVVTPGGKPIMFFAILALVDEGDEVLYPNPGFPIYESMIDFAGGRPRAR